MKLQTMYSRLRQAIEDFQMIEKGDKIAVGVSGGKDSMSLLYGLAGLQKFYPVPFELVAITVDAGYAAFDRECIVRFCEQLQIPYHIVKTDIKDRVTDKNPCFVCAKIRRGALNQKALELGCNKIAYAHHQDDVIDTMMLSLIYEGRFSTFEPITLLDGTNLKVFRPMIYVSESEVIGFRNKYQIPVAKNPCPYDHKTEREYAHELIRQINKHTPGVKKRMMTAVMNSKLPVWEDRIK